MEDLVGFRTCKAGALYGVWISSSSTSRLLCINVLESKQTGAPVVTHTSPSGGDAVMLKCPCSAPYCSSVNNHICFSDYIPPSCCIPEKDSPSPLSQLQRHTKGHCLNFSYKLLPW